MSDPSLTAIVRQAIDASSQRRITFAHYMDLALYHPEFGYYSRGRGLGAAGDFATSVHLCADFGELIAVQLAEMWQQLDRPARFDLIEMGAGQGILAGDILRYLRRTDPDCYRSIHYRIVEKSVRLRQIQQQQLQEFQADIPILWCELADIAEGSIVGCCLSNELLDAFPVHRVRLTEGTLAEIYVTYDETAPEAGWVEVTGDVSTPELLNYFREAGLAQGDRSVGSRAEGKLPSAQNPANPPPETSPEASARVTNCRILPDYPEGYTSEVNLAAKDWVMAITRILDRGYVLTIDYGYDTDRYYSPYRRDGTLNCYSHHHHHPDPYQNLGLQDITAHVDFGAIERWGKTFGLEPLGRTHQALFLMALGLGDRLSGLGQTGSRGQDDQAGEPVGNTTATAQDIVQVFQRHQVLRDLIDPQGLGGFQVLIQYKGDRSVRERSTLTGLSTPTMP